MELAQPRCWATRSTAAGSRRAAAGYSRAPLPATTSPRRRRRTRSRSAPGRATPSGSAAPARSPFGPARPALLREGRERPDRLGLEAAPGRRQRKRGQQHGERRRRELIFEPILDFAHAEAGQPALGDHRRARRGPLVYGPAELARRATGPGEPVTSSPSPSRGGASCRRAPPIGSARAGSPARAGALAVRAFSGTTVLPVRVDLLYVPDLRVPVGAGSGEATAKGR